MKTQWKAVNVTLGGTIIISTITLALGIFVGVNWTKITDQFAPYLGFKKTRTTELNYTTLDGVYEELATHYDGEISEAELIEGAKKGMVEAVGDKYTVYMDAKTAADFTTSLDAGTVGAGIGAMLSKTGEYTRVVRTLPDNPARKAGILAGDIIYKVNDEEVWDLDVEAIANKLRGTAGSQVKVTVVRDNAEHEFNITREVFNDVSIDVTYDGSTAIMSVYRFSQDTGTKAQEFAAKFKEKGINKVILDLRDNGGGYVNAARDLASLWIDGELVVTTSGRSVSSTPTYASRGKAYLKDIKTVIITNGSTASASEIVAGALKDYGKATIVGEKTYGKGVVQTMIDLDGGALLKVTTAKWYMPKGSSINGTGIIPDIEVGRSYDDINANRDPQMAKAREI